jgi:hypothetical protein
MNTTTKRYSRTLGDAFKGANYAAAIELPAPNVADKWIGRVCAIGCAVAVLMLAGGLI